MSDDVQGREHLVHRQQVLIGVFKRFKVHFRNAFAPALWDGMLEEWLRELRGIDTDVLDQAARNLISTGPQYPPKVWDLAKHARALRGDHTGPVHGPGSAVHSRIWFWVSPVTGRMSRAERRDDGCWIWHAIDDAEAFLDYGDAARIEYCESQAHEYAQRVADGRTPRLTMGAA